MNAVPDTSTPSHPVRDAFQCVLGACLVMALLYGAVTQVPWGAVGHGLAQSWAGVHRWVLAPIGHVLLQGLTIAAWLLDQLSGVWVRHSGSAPWISGAVWIATLCVAAKSRRWSMSETARARWQAHLTRFFIFLSFWIFFNGLFFCANLNPDFTALDSDTVKAQLKALDGVAPQADFSQQVAQANRQLSYDPSPVQEIRLANAAARTVTITVAMRWAGCRALAQDAHGWRVQTINGRPVSTPASILAACYVATMGNTVVLESPPGRWPAPTPTNP